MPDSVVAKFRLNSYTTQMHGRWENGKKVGDQEMRTLNFTPVSGPEGENKVFWDATPSGSIQLGTVNPEAWKQFELDGEYYVTFAKAK